MIFAGIEKFFNFVYRKVAELAWPALAIFVAVHFLVSWALFALAGEPEIASPEIAWYYYLTTATTIGYGDFAPKTLAGRFIASLWLMPGSIILFTAFIGKAIQTIAAQWRSRLLGKGDYSDRADHAVIFGWLPGRTKRLVEMLHVDERDDIQTIVLVGTGVEENPLPGMVEFVRASSLASDDALARSGVARARCAIIVGADDNESLTTALAISALSKRPRVVAYFETDSIADLLRAHAPQAECMVSISTELLARSAQDPGTSRVQRELLSPRGHATQFSVVVPDGAPPLPYGEALVRLKRDHDATLIGFARGPLGELFLNAPHETMIAPGDRLFFIASERLRTIDVDWTCYGRPAPAGRPPA